LTIIGQDLNRNKMLGEKLKKLREANGFVQRQVAAELQVDTAYISKMEHNEKPVGRNHLKKLSKLYNIPESDLFPIWLADKVFQIVEKEQFGKQALDLVVKKIRNEKSKP
jgi:transcriptional regulator with XRE-family HTH domain